MTKVREKGQDPNEVARIWRNTLFSWDGIKQTWKDEKSFRQWAYLNLASVILLVIIRPGFMPAGIILAAGGLILICELFNTAVEALVDYSIKEIHPLGKLAKDAASAAVMVSAIMFGILWLFALLERFL